MRRVLLRFGVFFVLVGGSVFFLLLSVRFQFKDVSLSGNAAIPSEEILRTVDAYLTERVLWFFPRNNVFLFRPRAFEARIRKEFPRIAEANVSRSYSRELTLYVAERSPWGLYCKTKAADCFYIAKDGVLTLEAPYFTGNAVFRITDYRTASVFFLLGDAAVNESDAAYIGQVVDFLVHQHHVVVREVALGRVFEDQMELITDEGWYVLFDERTNKERALENLALVLDQHITDRSMLEYIDIRFDGKVFYKNKNK
ncbi:MAG: Uncharacterized protein G01um101470_680 [Parcubacteria group bacterium Gr01-1014_70]|nr:MAG: Uncharacterized protein G01um101470_680 [Parcubacteria group bacterium Gr01-1014_70]